MSALHEDGLVAPKRPSAHDLYFEARRARAAMIVALIGLGVRALARLFGRPFDLSAPRPAQRAGGSSHHSWDLP